MPKVRNLHRKDPQKKFKCKICKKWKRGTRFYKSHTTLECVTCLSEKRKTQGGNNRCDVTDNPTRGSFMYMFKYVIKRLTIRKGLHWKTTVKWFSTHNPQHLDDHIRNQLKEQKLNIGDYQKTWILGFKQMEGLAIREQFKYRNLLVMSIKQ